VAGNGSAITTNTGDGGAAIEQADELVPSASPEHDRQRQDLTADQDEGRRLYQEGLRAFVKKHPNDRLVADANYWLGESLFQRQRYREAAESFLTVSTKFQTAGKAPDSLLRLGQSLAALKEKDAACATFGELPRKYPKAPANVRQAAEKELKRVGCG